MAVVRVLTFEELYLWKLTLGQTMGGNVAMMMQWFSSLVRSISGSANWRTNGGTNLNNYSNNNKSKLKFTI